MGRTLGENPMGPLPGSVDNSGVWNRAATERKSSNTARNPQPHSKLEKKFTLNRNNIYFRQNGLELPCHCVLYVTLCSFVPKTQTTIM